MIIEKYRYEFLSRMRRPEGLPPRVVRDPRVDLGTTPKKVYEASIALSLLLVNGAFVFFPSVSPVAIDAAPQAEFVKFEEIENTRQLNRPPPPPRPAIPIEAPLDEVLDDLDLASTEINLAEDVPPPPPAPESREEEYFIAVEEPPEPIGGLAAIQRTVVYPNLALRAGIEGRVFVLAYVNESGEVTRAEILKGIGGGCDEEALSAVKKARFSPGRQRGKPVKVKFSLPIRFQIEGKT